MTDRLFADCCYGSDYQHAPSQPCPQEIDDFADTVEAVGACELADWVRRQCLSGRSLADVKTSIRRAMQVVEITRG